MAVFRTVLKMLLNQHAELHVVIEDKSQHILLSLNEHSEGQLSRRTTMKLSRAQAMRMAMFLAGVGNLDQQAESIMVAKQVDGRFDTTDANPQDPSNQDWENLTTPPDQPRAKPKSVPPITQIKQKDDKG